MIIIDTSIWVEFLRGNQPFFDQVGKLLAKGEVASISPIFGELLQGAKNNRERAVITGFWDNIVHLPENELFIRAGAESGRNNWMNKGVGLIDGMIIVAARETSSFVWSLDKKLLGLLKREEKYLPDQTQYS
jgi:predicted nucleic acid-binding protein